ncbi:5-methylthioadenosine/S-adenosylhomocysteine deaminase [Clostridiales Family XIII bacterium PM5-7]
MSKNTKFLKAKYIVVWKDGSHHILENGYLAVEGKRIAGYMANLPENAQYEDLGNAAILPGFVNLHAHPSEVFSIKSYIEDCGNPNFFESTLMDYPFPSLGKRGAEIQTTLNLIELIKSGCTTSLIYGGPYSRLEADTAGEMGLRAYVGAGIRAGDRMEADSVWHSPDGHSVTYDFNEASGFERIREAEALVKDYDGTYDGRIRIMMGPTQSMTCTPAMLKETRKIADKLGVGITVHVAEDLAEVEGCIRLYGKTPVELLSDTGLLGEDVVLAHCVFISGHSQVFIRNNRDLKLLGTTKSNIAHSPTPFIRVGTNLESFAKYTDAGVNVGMGTDTFPSDMIQEMRLAAFMAKSQERTTYRTRGKDIFNAATVNGAKALGRDDLGKLCEGAMADFSIVDLGTIEMTPSRDIIKSIIYSGTRHSISQVYVEGKCVVRDGKVCGIDERSLCEELQAIGEEAWKTLRTQDGRLMDEFYPMSFPRLK